MVAPLTKLTRSGIEEGKVSRRISKRVGISWNGECEEAMIKLKDRISNAPVLSLPRYGEPFIVETDASNKGLGAVLSQWIEGRIRVIAFASRALSTGERVEANYSSKKLAFVAVIWAVSDKFRHYLIGSKCLVITDNSALSYLERDKTLTSLEQRWVARLAPFDITIKYRAGNLNCLSDALSIFQCRGDRY